MQIHLLYVSLLLALSAAGPIAAVQPRTDAVPDIKKLAQARIDAARKAYDVAVKLLVERIEGARPEDVYTWSIRLLNAERDQGGKPADLTAPFNDHHKRMQELAKRVEQSTKVGVGTPVDAAASDFYVKEAELWLAQAKAAAKQPDK